MTTQGMVSWIYERVGEEELTSNSQASSAVQRLNEEETRRDPQQRLRKFLQQIDVVETDTFQDTIFQKNEDWIFARNLAIRNAEDEDDLGVQSTIIENARGVYRNSSVQEAETSIQERLRELRVPTLSPQMQSIADVLGLDEEEVQKIGGIRAAQRQFEDQVSGDIESADTVQELETASESIDLIPTKAGRNRANKVLKKKRKELEG